MAMDASERMEEAIRLTAPGTVLRGALDMILAGSLGALICVGDTEKVLASGNDGFVLDVAVTANRLFELSKMDGAIVIDEDLTTILRANFHLNPDPSMPTSETGMRHRTAARMSMVTDAIVVSVSQRRSHINVYARGRSMRLRDVRDLGSEASELVVSLRACRDSLDARLARLTVLEFENFVTLGDLTRVYGDFILLGRIAGQLRGLVGQLGSGARAPRQQLEQLTGGMDEEFSLAVRDYAANSSADDALRVRREFDALNPQEMVSSAHIAHILGYDDLSEDSVVTPLGLRALSHVSAIARDAVERVAGEYGSLQALMEDANGNHERLRDLGVRNPAAFFDGLYRMWGKKG